MSPDDPASPADNDELTSLRQENAQLRQANERLSVSLAKYNSSLPPPIQCVEMVIAEFDAPNSAIAVLDGQLFIHDVNQQGAAIIGKTPAEMIGHNLAEFLAPETLHLWGSWVAQVMANSASYTFEDDYNGVHYHHRLFPYAGPDGPTGLVLTVVTSDIERQQFRDALNKSEHRYRAILGQVEMVCRWLPDLTLTYVNSGYCNLFGLRPEEMQGRSMLNFVQPEFHETILHMSRELVQKPRTMIIENKIIGRGGQVRWLEWGTCPIQNDEGIVEEFQSVGWDITERRNAEKALRESEARYRAIVEDQDELICRYLPGGQLTYVNQAYARYYKKDRSELVGHHFLPHIPEPDIANVLRHIYALSPATPVTVYENRIIRENNEMAWQRWTLRAIYNETGELMEYQTVGRDITKQKVADLALAEQRRFLRLVIDSLPNLIFVLDGDGRFVLASKAMSDLCGYTPEGLVNRRLPDACANADEGAKFLHKLFEVYSSGGMVIEPEIYLTNAQDERRCFSAVAILMEDNNRILGMAVDITDRKNAEEEKISLEKQLHQEQKLQALGTMAGGIAHDFNNMLFAIHGNIRLALKQPDLDKTTAYLLKIEKVARRATELVQQLLVFTHQINQSLERLHLKDILEEVMEVLRVNLPQTINIRLTIKTEHDTIMADATQISRLFLNLGTNAVQAMKDTGGILRFVLEEAMEEDLGPGGELGSGPMLLVRVEDTGTGIDSSIAEKIFDPFFTTKRPGEGSGMGLAMVDSIIKNHGGKILVQTKVGEGSVFSVFLPSADPV